MFILVVLLVLVAILGLYLLGDLGGIIGHVNVKAGFDLMAVDLASRTRSIEIAKIVGNERLLVWLHRLYNGALAGFLVLAVHPKFVILIFTLSLLLLLVNGTIGFDYLGSDRPGFEVGLGALLARGV